MFDVDISDCLNFALNVNKEKELRTKENSRNLSKVGIMGGTFDPIHYGHLVTAEYIRTNFELDRIIFIPSGDPPHKTDRIIIDKMHRYYMCVLATQTNENFFVSEIELKRIGKSYTIDTLREMKKVYPYSEIYFITGADALCDMETWKDVPNLFKEGKFIGATRPGVNLDSAKTKAQLFRQKYDAQIFNVSVPSLDISSTDLREKIKKDESIKYLLPESVEKYIFKYNLYR
ncbi:nicotinate-nucleotide adenylyltransferase [Alkalithermobacter paradoxus]|uniref:Probable nicotinate-nucleotide adenylyltransferase n=1 Tax=Alkalithermobacter paradoxus TaxID=29349 RepID=A0A1V4I6E8_9FIRM|nr:putative nicotinate-nucleotide adenylyltransferase [[Clostridium] thermoalcaliphilum]